MPIASNIKPNLNSVPELQGINYDEELIFTLGTRYNFINFEPITVNNGESLFVEIIRTDYASSSDDTAIRLWSGENKRNQPNTLDVIHKVYFTNNGVSEIINVVINKFGGFGGDEPLNSGEFKIRISRTSFKDGSTTNLG